MIWQKFVWFHRIFFSVKLPKSTTRVFTDFSFSVKSHKSRRGFRGRIATKVCFLLLVVSIPLIFFRDVFYNSIGLSQVCRGQKLWYNTGKYFFVSWIFKTLGVLTIYFIDVFLNHQYSNYWIRWSNLLFFNSWILFIYVLTKRW